MGHSTSPRLNVQTWPSVAALDCLPQVLVIDQRSGPASLLIDTVSLLLGRPVSVTQVESHGDALRALDNFCFDLAVVGLAGQDTRALGVLPLLHKLHPDLPVLSVGRDLPRLYRQYARDYGAREVLTLPGRAADLKALVRHLDQHYLP